MVSFKGKLLSQEDRIGDVLRAYRKRRGFSIKDIAFRLGLAPHFIDCLESCKYHKLPGEVYAKNFVRRYARLVGINEQEACEQYTKERPLRQTDKKVRQSLRKRLATWWHPALLTRLAGIAVLIIVVGYVGLQARNIFSAPPLAIDSPSDGMVSKVAIVQMFGHSLPETKIQINGREIITGTSGDFVEFLDLAPGMNTFTIVAIKKHGARTTVVRNILLEEKVSVVPTSGVSLH